MLKRKVMFILNLIFIGLSIFSCAENVDTSIVLQNKYPLVDFSVKVADSYYHAKIDQKTHRIEIGTIVNPNSITGVDYLLKNEGTLISPNPTTFIGRWEKEQKITVTTEDKVETVYTIVLTKLDEEVKDVIFMDDFDIDGIPNVEKWSLCKKESSDWNDEMSESNDQAYVKDGNLVLIAEKVDDTYKAGGIESINKFSFTFGKVEVRARITQYPDGAFPAIWMMPQTPIYSGWPNGGEIDIMEHIKQDESIFQTIHTNYTYNLKITDPANHTTVKCNFVDYNVYGMEWNEDALIFSVNGVQSFTYPNLRLEDEAEKMQWPFTKASSFYLMLNMGLGGDREGSWPGPIDDANLPAKMEIDWVKVSRLSESAE